MIEENYIEFRNTGQELVDVGLTKGTGGCLSKHLNEGILVSATGAQLGNLSKKDLSLIKEVRNNKIYWMGDNKPSSESPLLFELYLSIPNVKTIIHGHCPRITYDKKMQKYATPAYVRYGCFGEGKKIANILEQNGGFVILRFHGEISIGESLKESFKKLKQKMEEAHER
ncbi:MAG: class II aldolase/adducin family protein [Nanoarchaeota archaeon]|nr:class II aldolase/adducin family protein [Nanoarchaeota archaeon]MBU0962383.1 class II aldolase/adducin family protein [Nanoarchaeota archaeon]